MIKSKSLNNRRQVQSDFLKRVERLCGQVVAERVNKDVNFYVGWSTVLPDYVLKSHYRSLASGISKPVKYINKTR